ncbi:hypothetical protein E0Z10_g8685 [Xylaria hypoxylon]|uniref:Glycosyl hydrolase family 30 TIM-barrel domain-containing protein n=1 Tax=Xylaria hypoxylon TaxID=37992 RepID=A0A4Z0YR91_9PEZI|nr:hypothetical protein E0Z10_g8685 [Xylaria hypoxylon]
MFFPVLTLLATSQALAAPVSGRGTGGSSTWDLSINDTASGRKQTIIGFGGSVTDATITHFSFLRHTIASSDLSCPPVYTYDDAGGNANPNLQNFNIGDRDTAMAKMLTAIRSVKSGVTILGSPWSASGWMKLNRVRLEETADTFLPQTPP